MIMSSVCLSACDTAADGQTLWLNDTSYSKSVWTSEYRNCLPRNTILRLSTPYTDSSLKLPVPKFTRLE